MRLFGRIEDKRGVEEGGEAGPDPDESSEPDSGDFESITTAGDHRQSYCTECGAAVGRDTKFCGPCGHSVTAAVPPTAQPEPPAPARRRRNPARTGCGLIVLVVAVIIVIGAVAGGKSHRSGTTATGGSGVEGEAKSYITSKRLQIGRIDATAQTILVLLGQAIKNGGNEHEVSELATAAQKAHDQIDEERHELFRPEGNEQLGQATLEVEEGANELKNSMGALVAYTGNPNPATLAHVNVQFEHAKSKWDEGVTTIWSLAHESKAPTLEPTTQEGASGTGATTTSSSQTAPTRSPGKVVRSCAHTYEAEHENGQSVRASSNTSCSFAVARLTQYRLEIGSGRNPNAAGAGMLEEDEKTHHQYEMTCDDNGSLITCTGGNHEVTFSSEAGQPG
jgi:hypothetical protein